MEKYGIKTSFRDPSGCVIEKKGQIFREINHEAHQLLELLQTFSVVKQAILNNELISYKIVSTIEQSIVLEHPKVWFPSYPYEWSYGMLFDAAMLTNQFAWNLQKEGLGLKDATPYNILFQGVKPIFVDIASIEKREACDPIWRPYSQFLNMFLLPLLMNREFGLGIREIFFSEQEGLSPEYCSHFGVKWKKVFFTLVVFPQFLSKFSNIKMYSSNICSDVELCQFVLNRRFRKNQKLLHVLQPISSHSKWSCYMTNLSHYAKGSFQEKERFVENALTATHPQFLLDVGCNTGHFSKLAAKKNIKVVAIDYDCLVIDRLFQDAKREQLDILPLVVNLSRPSPAMGWKNRETWSFLQRSENRFEFILMLAVIHHMLITDRIPMEEIASLVSLITTKWALVEYICPSDPMFKALEKGRNLYSHLTFEFFKKCFGKYFSFECMSDDTYHPTRSLVLLKKL